MNKVIGKSWVTSVAGIVAAACAGVVAADLGSEITTIAGVISAIAVGILGLSARDNNKTSKQAGAE